MKQDPQFTAKLQEWMNTPDEQKDWAEGAILLLQLSGNQIMYRNISVNPKGKAEFIKGQLQKYLNFRLQQLTHEEVTEMQSKVETIVKEVIKPAESSEFAEFKAGKRGDHDSLPDDIKVLYAENLDIVHRMRELHLKLRTLSTENATCPDSERYPFLKEIIALDKKLHENWDAYDHYVVDNAVSTVSETDNADKSDASAETDGSETAEAGSPASSAETEQSEDNGTGTSAETAAPGNPAAEAESSAGSAETEQSEAAAAPADAQQVAPETATQPKAKRTRKASAKKTTAKKA